MHGESEGQGEGFTPASPEYFRVAVAAGLNHETFWALPDVDKDSHLQFFYKGVLVGSIVSEDDGGYRGYVGAECVTGDDPVSKDKAQASVELVARASLD